MLEDVLVVCPSWVGDLVMATPAFEALYQAMPHTKFSCLVRPSLAAVVADAPWFQEIYTWNKKHLWATAQKLAHAHFDMGILFPNSMRSALLVWLAGIPRRLGYARNGRSWLLNMRLRPLRQKGRYQPVPMVDYYLALAARAGATTEQPRLKLYFRPSLQEQAHAYLRNQGVAPNSPLIAINPGASFGAAKCWGAERFARLIQLLARNLDHRILLLCGPGEEKLVRQIWALAHCSTLIDTSEAIIPLDLLKPIIAACALLITNDTGPRHYAEALQTPVITLIGPTDPIWGQPPSTSPTRSITLVGEAPCAPCMLRTCPYDHACMQSITPEKVYLAALALLDDPASGGSV